MNYQNDLADIKKLIKCKFDEDFEGNVVWLDKGLTNRSYRVDLKAGQFVVRLPGQGTEELINRRDEFKSNEIACNLGVDTDLIYFDPNTGVKICTFIPDAITMSPELMRQESNIIMAALLLKKLHSSNINSGVEFNVPEKIDDYEAYICKNGISLYDDYNINKQQILKVASRFGTSKRATCHNDPLCENWVYGNDRMYLIDWEYAGMNDPMWDVAVVSVESSMGDNEDQILLTNYLGCAAKTDDMIRFLANKVLLDFLWSLWGKTRIPVSGMEMENYARLRYERMLFNQKVLNDLLR